MYAHIYVFIFVLEFSKKRKNTSYYLQQKAFQNHLKGFFTLQISSSRKKLFSNFFLTSETFVEFINTTRCIK